MVPWRASEDGTVSDRVLDWYERFATGRPGVIVIEATGVRDVASGPLLRASDDRYAPGLAELARVIKRASRGETLVFVQLIDFLSIKRRPEPEKYFSRFLALTDAHRDKLCALDGDPQWSSADEPSVRARLASLDDAALDRVLDPRELESLRYGHRERVTDTHLPHIRALPEALPALFADAAARVVNAGFDGVELHYAHAYTMASFLSATNSRDDGYGRTLGGRLRLPLEVLSAVRARLPSSVAVGCRILGDEAIEGGTQIQEASQIAVALAGAGADFISVSKGGKFEDAAQPRVGHAAYPYTGPSGHECMPTVRSDDVGPFGRNLPLSRAVRAALRAEGLATPVVGAGGINGFRLAERALADGDCDIVASARQSLADPDWFDKVRAGRGHEVRRCKFTNYCEALDQLHKEVTCQLWDKLRPGDPPEPLRSTSQDGRRRLLAPRWSRDE
jgi:2,4-dienoyl-CoA reductase-like NADH-dependent reductase (Old Yellow Enzyme family)